MKRATTVLLLLLAAFALGPPTLASSFTLEGSLAQDLAEPGLPWTEETFVPSTHLNLDLPKDTGFEWSRFMESSAASSKGSASGFAKTVNLIKSAPGEFVSLSVDLAKKFNPLKLLSSREGTENSDRSDVAASEGESFPLTPRLVNNSKGAEFSVFEKENARLMTAQRTVDEINQTEQTSQGSRWGAPVLKMFILMEDYGRE